MLVGLVLDGFVVGGLIAPAAIDRKARMSASDGENPFEAFRFVGSRSDMHG